MSPTAGDFFQFWFAGHLVATGSSPYDQTEWVSAYARYGDLAAVVRHNCPTIDAPACRWAYPPWTGWLLAPFGLLDPGTGIALEGLVFLALLAVGVTLVVRASRVDPAWLRALALVSVALSAPFVTDAFGGHFDGLLLIGLWLVGAGLAGRNPLPLAVAAPILALKAHLFLAFAPLVLVWLVRERQPRLIWVPAAVIFVLTIAGLASDPRALPAITGAGAKLGLVGSTTWSLASRTGASAPVAALAMVTAGALGAAATVRWSRPLDVRVFVAAAAAFSLVVAPYVQLYDHLLLVPAVALAVSFASASGRRLVAVGIVVAFVVASWGAHALEQQEGRSLAGLIPVAVLVVLAATTHEVRRSAPAEG